MVGYSLLQVSTCLGIMSSSLITAPRESSNFLHCLPTRPQKKLMQIRAISPDTGHSQPPSSSPEKRSSLAVVLGFPQSIWRQTLKPLNDFAFGGRGIWEGWMGLFLVSGTVFLVISLAWLRRFQMQTKFRKYLAVFEFAQACGISTGTPARIRGVTIGNVIRVNLSLNGVEAVVKVEDDKTIIPRNSLVEVNQSGLLMETLIDITPRDLFPSPSVGPLDAECVKEGLIVCDRQKIQGYQGTNMDELIRKFTQLGRDIEIKSYLLAERVTAVIEEAKPLLTMIQAMAEDVQPLLAEVHDTGLLKEVEILTRSLTQASEELRRTHTTIMTPANAELIQKSIYSLIFTLKNIENISSDITRSTGDEAIRQNLKVLIKSLSRSL